MASDAASLRRFSIFLGDDINEDSLSSRYEPTAPLPDRFLLPAAEPLPAELKSSFFPTFAAWEGSFGLESLSQKAVT